MIGNVSRTQGFQTCRRKQHFYDIGLSSVRLAEPLSIGSAYHEGCAYLTSKRDKAGALAVAEQRYRDDIAKQTLVLPEERALHERNITLIKRMLTAQAEQYVKDTWTVLMPEVEGLVPIPHTEHHCWFFHKLLHPTVSVNTVCDDERCIQPHYLKFRTDAILNWNPLIWILERKTSGMMQNIFWDQWYLSHQLTAYVYGVRKTTGLPVNGVMLEKMPKPAKNRDPLTFDYTPEREPYVRSEDDIVQWEREFTAILTDYENACVRLASGAHLDATFYRNPQSCTSYNRTCDFWEACKRGHVNEGEFRQRDQDYVEAAYYEVLGIPNSCSPKEENDSPQ